MVLVIIGSLVVAGLVIAFLFSWF